MKRSFTSDPFWALLRRMILVATAGVALSLSFSSVASAVGTAPGQRRPMQSRQPATVRLTTVVVTAEKRRENLQNVPISVQVISGRTIAQRNLGSLVDLSQIAPTVDIAQGGRSDNMFIRGIGSGENGAFEQSVGTFVDDIYHGRSRMSAATFLDIERVEILKGPQSTFFGNNAIAGALNITTRRPGRRFDASARVMYGSYGRYALEAAAGGPVTDRVGVRVALIRNGQRGWLDNVAIGKHEPRENNLAGRLTLVFRPVHDVDATLMIQRGRNRNSGALAMQEVGCPPSAPFQPTGFCALNLSLHSPLGFDTNNVAYNRGQLIHLDTTTDELTVNYRHRSLTFTSVSGYYNYHFNDNLDTDNTPLTLINVHPPEHYSQFSEEFRVASPTDQTLEYMLGAYFQTDHLYLSQNIGFFFLSPIIASIPPFAPLVPYLPIGQQIDFSQEEHSWAVFGSLTWNVTSRLRLTGGLRGSWVPKSYHWHLYYGTQTQDYGGTVPLPAPLQPFPSFLGLGVPGTLSGSRSDSAWMPSARIQYRIEPSAMVYFSYARGFKSGGFNSGDNSGIASNLPFGPEHVNAYEAGLKSKWIDDTLLFNLDVFREDYSDLQVAVNILNPAGTYVTFVRNAAASRSQGVEFQGQWLAGRHLRFGADVAYLDSRYTSYPNVSPTQLQQFYGIKSQNLAGRPTEFAPNWSGSLSAIFTTPLPGDYRLTAALSPFFSSSYFLTSNDDDTLRQKSYVRLDARLTLQAPNGHWALDLIGKNMTNRNIAVWGTSAPSALGTSIESKEEPANYAVQVQYHW